MANCYNCKGCAVKSVKFRYFPSLYFPDIKKQKLYKVGGKGDSSESKTADFSGFWRDAPSPHRGRHFSVKLNLRQVNAWQTGTKPVGRKPARLQQVTVLSIPRNNQKIIWNPGKRSHRVDSASFSSGATHAIRKLVVSDKNFSQLQLILSFLVHSRIVIVLDKKVHI